MLSRLITSLRTLSYGEPSGEAFREELRMKYKDHKEVTYKQARILMYNEVDCEDNMLYMIYGGEPYPWKCHQTKNPPGQINAEHTVPQSFFSKKQPMVTDLHHLISAPHQANELRSNFKFNEFPYSMCATYCKGLKCSTQRPANPSEYSCLSSEEEWMPREADRGQVARMVLYFYTMYDKFDMNRVGELKTFLEWNRKYPPTQREKTRNAIINQTQGNANPYVLSPSWADRAWADKI